MAIDLTLQSGKVQIDVNNGEDGWIISTSSNVNYRDNDPNIYIAGVSSIDHGNSPTSIRLRITEINGRPNDTPKDVAEWLRDNFFFKLVGLGENSPTVPTFADLPDPNLFSNNTIYFVETSTGYITIGGVSIPTSINAKKFGFYYVDGIAPSKMWVKIKGGFTASEVYYDNTTTGLTAQTVQAAIDELIVGGIVISVNGQSGVVTLDTDDIPEGATNLYYTEARVSANTDVVANTSKVSADGSIATHSDVSLTGIVLNDILQWNGSSFVPAQIPVAPVTSVNGQTGVVVLDTDDVSEGITNLYYTESRVSANTDVSQNTTHRGLTNNPHLVTSTQVGLGNVDNTSDLDKPVSTAQAAADAAVQAFSIQRVNHTGTQLASTISDFDTAIVDSVSNNAGQIKLNWTVGTRPESPSGFTGGIPQSIPLNVNYTVSSSPTTTYPFLADELIGGENVIDPATLYLRELLAGQSIIFRVKVGYENKGAGQNGNVIVRMFNPNPGSTLVIPKSIPTPDGTNEYEEEFEFIAIADSLSLDPLYGYEFEAETTFSDGNLIVYIQEITAFYQATDLFTKTP